MDPSSRDLLPLPREVLRASAAALLVSTPLEARLPASARHRSHLLLDVVSHHQKSRVHKRALRTRAAAAVKSTGPERCRQLEEQEEEEEEEDALDSTVVDQCRVDRNEGLP